VAGVAVGLIRSLLWQTKGVIMPAERITMRQAREIIRLKSSSMSAHEISRRLGMARSTVREALKRAESAGLSWPLPDGIAGFANSRTVISVNPGHAVQ
jgi:DNA-binding MarR family transcriptional regulator